MKDLQASAAALYDGGWRSTDRDQLMEECQMTEDEAVKICELLARWEKDLLGIKEVGDILGWSRQKVSVYYSRGKLPEPYTLVGGKRPVWEREKIIDFFGINA